MLPIKEFPRGLLVIELICPQGLVVVQLLSHDWILVTPQTIAHHAPLSSTISQMGGTNSCPLRPSHPLRFPSPLSSVFPGIRLFYNESTLHIRWPKYWSFSISPSNEYSRLISFRIDQFDSPCSPRDSQKSSPTPQFKSINSLALSFLYSPTLTSMHDYWKKIIQDF